MQQPRKNALPENYLYTDTGCDYHPACLTCPFPECRYDHPQGMKGIRVALMEVELPVMRERGATVNEMAGRFQVSRRTVFRILRRSKK